MAAAVVVLGVALERLLGVRIDRPAERRPAPSRWPIGEGWRPSRSRRTGPARRPAPPASPGSIGPVAARRPASAFCCARPPSVACPRAIDDKQRAVGHGAGHVQRVAPPQRILVPSSGQTGQAAEHLGRLLQAGQHPLILGLERLQPFGVRSAISPLVSTRNCGSSKRRSRPPVLQCTALRQA